MSASVFINVAAIENTDWTTGPGRFLTLWVQGCRKRCPGCINPDYQALRIARLEAPQMVFDMLDPAVHEGVCFTGGEPFLQARSLAVLARLAHKSGFGVVSFSGYTLAELRSGTVPGAPALLRELDILIDGPFLRQEAAILLWRGSGNQAVHLLSSRYPRKVLEHPPVTEFHLRAGSATMFGAPNPAVEALIREMERFGIRMNTGHSGSSADRPGTFPPRARHECLC